VAPWETETQDLSQWSYFSSILQARIEIQQDPTVSQAWETENMEGLVILADSELLLDCIVAEVLQHYPIWVEERRTYKEEDYPKAGYVYKIQISLHKGINHIGWIHNTINYRRDIISSIPTFTVLPSALYILQQYEMAMDGTMQYSEISSPLPQKQTLLPVPFAPPKLTMLTATGKVPSLFTLAMKSSLLQFYAQHEHKRPFGNRGQITKHFLHLRRE
jgi:hypothetical protein